MTVKEFFGCALISFGPPFAMFCLSIAKDPIRIIILVAASFFWLLSLLLSSILWFAVTPLRDVLVFGVVFSVLFQELFRFIFYRILRVAETGLQKVSEVGVQGVITPLNRVSLSYVAGLGFGIMSGAFSLVNVLADAAGPGTVGIKGDSPNFFIVSAFTTLAFILLHTFWGVIFFQSLDRRNYVLTSSVVLCHLFVSLMSLLNQNYQYAATLVTTYVMVLLSGFLAFTSSGGSIADLKSRLNSRGETQPNQL